MRPLSKFKIAEEVTSIGLPLEVVFRQGESAEPRGGYLAARQIFQSCISFSLQRGAPNTPMERDTVGKLLAREVCMSHKKVLTILEGSTST